MKKGNECHHHQQIERKRWSSLQKNFKPQNITCHATPHVSHTSMLKKVTTCRSTKEMSITKAMDGGGSVKCYMLNA
jgi:hypothetical protein